MGLRCKTLPQAQRQAGNSVTTTMSDKPAPTATVSTESTKGCCCSKGRPTDWANNSAQAVKPAKASKLEKGYSGKAAAMTAAVCYGYKRSDISGPLPADAVAFDPDVFLFSDNLMW